MNPDSLSHLQSAKRNPWEHNIPPMWTSSKGMSCWQHHHPAVTNTASNSMVAFRLKWMSKFKAICNLIHYKWWVMLSNNPVGHYTILQAYPFILQIITETLGQVIVATTTWDWYHTPLHGWKLERGDLIRSHTTSILLARHACRLELANLKHENSYEKRLIKTWRHHDVCDMLLITSTRQPCDRFKTAKTSLSVY